MWFKLTLWFWLQNQIHNQCPLSNLIRPIHHILVNGKQGRRIKRADNGSFTRVALSSSEVISKLSRRENRTTVPIAHALWNNQRWDFYDYEALFKYTVLHLTMQPPHFPQQSDTPVLWAILPQKRLQLKSRKGRTFQVLFLSQGFPSIYLPFIILKSYLIQRKPVII